MNNIQYLLNNNIRDQLNRIEGNWLDWHGFRLARQKLGESTIIQYKAANGQLKRIAVKDAKFRKCNKFGTYGKNVSELRSFTSRGATDWFITGNYELPSSKMEMPDFFTNEAIYQYWSPSLKTDLSAKENCDVWMQYNDYNDGYVIGVPLVAHCRSQNILGIPCNLPNIYELICIWTCSNELDKMDPTASQYPNYKIGNTAIDRKLGEGHTQEDSAGIGYFLCASTNWDDVRIRRVGYTGYCQCITKNTVGTTIPILEI